MTKAFVAGSKAPEEMAVKPLGRLPTLQEIFWPATRAQVCRDCGSGVASDVLYCELCAPHNAW